MRHREYGPSEQDILSGESSEGRARIVRAAYPLFAEQGYSSVSMQEIADAVSLNKATLYHHFHNKDDLFLAVVRMAMSRLYEQIQGFMREGGTAADQLTRVAVQVFQDSQSEFGRLMTDARIHLSPDQQQMLVERCSDPWSLYEQIVAAASQNGEIPNVDPILVTTMFAGLLQGQTWSLKTGRIQPPLDHERARLLVDTLFGGLNAVFSDNSAESEVAAK